MSTHAIVVTTLSVLASVVTLLLLYRSASRDPVKELQGLAEAFSAVDKAPQDVRPVLRAQLLETAATRHFAPPVRSWLLLFMVWVTLAALTGTLSPASPTRKTMAVIGMVLVYPAMLWFVTRTDIYGKRRRTHALLLAVSRDALSTFVEERKDVDIRSVDDKRLEAFQEKAVEWVRTTRGAREAILLVLLALLILGILGMASDFGWL